MEQDARQATDVGAIALPVELVELQHMRTRPTPEHPEGAPVVVRCELVNELLIAEVLGLPGQRPAEGPVPTGAAPEPLDEVKAMARYAPAIIQAGTVLAGGPSGTVRPGFAFPPPARLLGQAGEDLGWAAPWSDLIPEASPLSVPGSLLREEDKLLILTAILRVSGYIGEAAAGGSFPGERAGGGDELGAGDAGEVLGVDPDQGAA